MSVLQAAQTVGRTSHVQAVLSTGEPLRPPHHQSHHDVSEEALMTPPHPRAAIRYLTIKEAAHEAGVCRRTIYSWLLAKRLSVMYTPSGRTRIEAASLWCWRKPKGTR